MEKNLFLTGDIGCGKSTCIAEALGDALGRAGGFLTVRQRDARGRVEAFWLQSPDGGERQKIIDCSAGKGTVYPEVFSSFGVRLLEEARNCPFVVLDEIGGFEVLSEDFMDALMTLLRSDVPCIGVMKGEGPVGRLIQTMGLAEACAGGAEALRSWMDQNENTRLYTCGRFDPEGLQLAREWAAAYLPRETEDVRNV